MAQTNMAQTNGQPDVGAQCAGKSHEYWQLHEFFRVNPCPATANLWFAAYPHQQAPKKAISRRAYSGSLFISLDGLALPDNAMVLMQRYGFIPYQNNTVATQVPTNI